MSVHVHSVSALIKFHTSISKSVTVHNIGFVHGQTLQVEIDLACTYVIYLGYVHGQTLQVEIGLACI